MAENLKNHLNETWDDDTKRSIGSLELIDASKQLNRKAEPENTNISIPNKQLELWLTIEETTE